MTTPAAAPAATPATATPATNNTPAPAATDTANAGANAPSSATPPAATDAGKDKGAAPADGSAPKDSTGNDGAAPADKKPGDADQPQDGGQSSDGKPSDDPDKKGQEDQGKEEGTVTQEYQQAAEKVELPEGMEMDKTALEAVVPVLKKYNVPPEAMQELMPVAAAMVSRAMKAQADKHEAQVTEWYDQTVATHGKEGAEAFEQKQLVANRAIKKFFSETDRKVLKEQGLGNLPGLFTLAYQVGLQMGEDGSTSAPGNGGKGEETLADVWYPKKD